MIKEIKMLFENTDVKIINENGNVLFEIYSTGMAIGYITIAKGKSYPHKTRIDKTIKNAGISTVVHGVQHFLTQENLFDFMIEAHTEKCKLFRKWVTNNVLPEINSSGGYVTTGDEELFINTHFESISDNTKKSLVIDLQKANKDKDDKLKEKDKKIAELTPQAEAYRKLMEAQGYLQFIDVSAMVEVGRTKLMEFLRNNKVLTKQSNYNVPYGRFAKNGMFKVIVEETRHGKIGSVTMVSPKGLNYIYKLINKKNMQDEFDISKLLGGQANA